MNLFVCLSSDDLLRNCATLLDELLDASEELLEAWAGRSLVEAICEAIQQIWYGQ